MNAPTAGASFRPDIQGLRAIAVVLVLLCHANVPGFAGGFVGVDIFFVLSGYLITGLLVHEQLTSGRIHYWRFLARRLRRLLPAMLVMLLLTVAIGLVVLTPYELRMQTQSFPFAVTWISNLYFAFYEQDYFLALQSKDLFLHTWSLGVEEQFYVLWPWLILAFFGLRMPGVRTKRDNLLVALVVLFTVGLALCVYLSAILPTFSFYMMPTRAWQFAMGASVYIGLQQLDAEDVHESVRRLSDRNVAVMSYVGVALIAGASCFISPQMNYPGFLALIPSTGAALLLAAGKINRQAGIARMLSAGSFVWVGDRSYSIYLWHWPVLVLGSAFSVLNSSVGTGVLLVVSVALASVSYKWIEYPIWKGRLSTMSTARTALCSTWAILAAILFSVGLESAVLAPSISRETSADYNPRIDVPREIHGAHRGCDSWYHSADLTPCNIGSNDHKFTAVLLGDSIAAQWAPLLGGIFPVEEWRILVHTKSACAIVDVDYFYHAVGGNYDICTEWRNAALDHIAAIEPDVVVVGSSAAYDFSETEWREGSARILHRLSADAGRVVLISGTPMLSFDGPSCLEDPSRFSLRLSGGHRECEEAEFDGRRVAVSANLRAVTTQFSNISFLDLGDLICPNGLCAAQSPQGVVTFRDQHHLTASFVQSLTPDVRDRLLATGFPVLAEEEE